MLLFLTIVLLGVLIYLIREIHVLSKRKHTRGWRWWGRVAVTAAISLVLVYQTTIFVRVFRLRSSNPRTTSFMEQQTTDTQARSLLQNERIWIQYDHISPHLVRAVIASEDKNFVYHSGFDWRRIQDAVTTNWSEGRSSRGGSTISQQLAKNLFLSSSKSLLRKLQETVITSELEFMLTKRRILEIYLNVIEWGDGIYGAEAAARHYFNTSAALLTAEQAAYLASIIPTPRIDHKPDSPDPPTRFSMDLILEYMHELEIP
jgi:monofunctional glycosyltransferase